MRIREATVEVSWVLKGKVYHKTTLITERIPADDVNTCDWCGDPIFDGRSDRKFCNQSHKNAYWRRQNKGG